MKQLAIAVGESLVPIEKRNEHGEDLLSTCHLQTTDALHIV